MLVFLSGCAASLSGGIEDNREPADLQPVREGDGIFHTVQAGESLASLARAYKVPLDDIAGLNDRLPTDPLKAGEKIFVPGAHAQVAAAPAPSDQHEEEVALEKNRGTLAWPLDGVVTSRFGIREGRHHDGIDIAAPLGSAVTAADAGQVIFSGVQRGYGNTVVVKHQSGLVTIYAHNKENLVKEGAAVTRGQRLASVGQTGRATGPNLHFEVRQGEHPKNPLLFLPR